MANGYASGFNDKLRWDIRYRDSLRCFLCGRLTFFWELHVHHIDYNKKNTDSENLISLCFYCHARTGFNRFFWMTYFQKEVKGRLNVSSDLSFIDDEYVFED